MAKYYGKIGFANTVETSPGIYNEDIIERSYYGDFYRIARGTSTSDKINDDISISNEISIISDPYVLNALYAIKYITWNGTKWKINNITVETPRLRLTLGGIYNE